MTPDQCGEFSQLLAALTGDELLPGPAVCVQSAMAAVACDDSPAADDAVVDAELSAELLALLGGSLPTTLAAAHSQPELPPLAVDVADRHVAALNGGPPAPDQVEEHASTSLLPTIDVNSKDVDTNNASNSDRQTNVKSASPASTDPEALANTKQVTGSVTQQPEQRPTTESSTKVLLALVNTMDVEKTVADKQVARPASGEVQADIAPAMLSIYRHADTRFTDGAQSTAHYQLHTQVGSREWHTELGNKLSLMSAGAVQSARLSMTPEELGPVEVRIDTHRQQVNVWFAADHADTRHALEQSLPRLRELFAAQGMNLSDAGVSGQAAGQQANHHTQRQAANWSGRVALQLDATLPAPARQLSLSMLDLYA
jgi:flagellar hook-length control protein FliK